MYKDILLFTAYFILIMAIVEVVLAIVKKIIIRKLDKIKQPAPRSKKVVYIAHPIGGDVNANIVKVCRIYAWVSQHNPRLVPFAPYIATVLAMDDNIPACRELGISHDMELFERRVFDEVWLFGGRISDGMQHEIDKAKSLGIPVIDFTALKFE